MQRDIFKYACLSAFLETAYIGLVACFFFYISHSHFQQKPDTILAPMMVLMLFVFSAAVTGALMLGKPILWYLDGKKKEAIRLFLSTLLAFFVLMLATFLIFATLFV